MNGTFKQERESIMKHYSHILGWIDSCKNTDQIMICGNAVETFAKVFAGHSSADLLYSDLNILWCAKHNSLAGLEMDTLKANYEKAAV